MHTGNNALTVQQEVNLNLVNRQNTLDEIFIMKRCFLGTEISNIDYIDDLNHVLILARIIDRYYEILTYGDEPLTCTIVGYLKIGTLNEQIARSKKILQGLFIFNNIDTYDEFEAYVLEYGFYGEGGVIDSDCYFSVLCDVLSFEGIHMN